MNKKIMKNICLMSIILPIFPVYAENTMNISGKYSDGISNLNVEKTGEDSTYKIIGSDPGGYKWESIGFYSNDCSCIKGVFKYISHKDVYGDNVGYQEFIVKNNGNTLIKTGGWTTTKEFGEVTFNRTK